MSGVMEGVLSPVPSRNERMTAFTSLDCAEATGRGAWKESSREQISSLGNLTIRENTGGEDQQVHRMESLGRLPQS